MVTTDEASQVCRAAGSLLYPSLDFGAKPNGTYSSEDFARVLTRSAFEQEFTNTSARHLQLTRGDAPDLEDGSPLAKSLLYNLGRMEADAIDAQFDGVRDQLIDQTKRARQFPTTAEAALDLHEWLYYGSDQTPMVSRINPERGTNPAYVFVTLCIVSRESDLPCDDRVLRMVVTTERDEMTWFKCETCGLMFDDRDDAKQHEENCDDEDPSYLQ